MGVKYVKHGKWFYHEIDGKLWKAKFVDYGFHYADLKVQKKYEVKIFGRKIFDIWLDWTNFNDFLRWCPSDGTTKDKIELPQIGMRQSFYDSNYAIERLELAIHLENRWIEYVNNSKNIEHTKVI